MKRVAEDGEWNIPLLEQCENIPEPAMQNGVAARDVEVGQTLHAAAHLHTIVHYLLRPSERHLHQFGMSFGKDVTMLTTLVAAVGDVPLKSEIFHKVCVLRVDYLSPAPQAEPQAAGFGSG